jgi:four helix bundle protein
MNERALALQQRTRTFATAVIEFCESLPAATAAQTIGSQLISSATSVDSNYRAACRARSTKEFIGKIGLVVEEADESLGWLQLLVRSHIRSADSAERLLNEANELVAIFVASEKTARRNYETELARRKSGRRKSTPGSR